MKSAEIGKLVTKSLYQSLEKISSAATARGLEADLLDGSKPGDFANSYLAGEFLRIAAEAGPPSNNMGGTYPLPPLFFSHCEKTDHSIVNRTKLDWLGFTVKPKTRKVNEDGTQEHGDEMESVLALLQICFPGVVSETTGRGMPGYPQSFSLSVDGVQLGLLGTGAAHGRHFVSLTGTACKRLSDDLVELLYEALSLDEMDARLSRVDICFDVFGGVTWDHAVRAYQEGRFKRPRASKNPEFKKVESGSEFQNFGRTFYVGKRDGEVMARVYEKGLEMFARMPEELRDQCVAREEMYEGEKPFADDWLRLEAEYKRVDKDRPLPLEMLIERDRYFAGAYPYFAEVLGLECGKRPVQLKSDAEIDLLKLIHHAKRSYGTLIHSMSGMGFTDTQIRQELSADHHNPKLVKSGLLALVKKYVEENPDSDIPF